MSTLSLLVLEADSRAFALRLDQVSTISRPLPIDPVPGVPPFVRGIATFRGMPLPVVDLAMLLGASEATEAERFVAVNAGPSQVLLAVSAVRGIHALEATDFAELPSLLREAKGRAFEAIASLDAHLLILLEGSRLVPHALLEALAPEARAGA